MRFTIELEIKAPDGVYNKATQITDDILELMKEHGYNWIINKIETKIIEGG